MTEDWRSYAGRSPMDEATAVSQKRSYTRIHPANYEVMTRLHKEHGLTYAQIADLYGCSRSRVVQLVNEHRQKTA